MNRIVDKIQYVSKQVTSVLEYFGYFLFKYLNKTSVKKINWEKQQLTFFPPF